MCGSRRVSRVQVAKDIRGTYRCVPTGEWNRIIERPHES